jgi:hypothetical protein
MDSDDFWSGVRLVADGLGDAAKRASYSLGLGTGSLGGAIIALNHLGVTGIPSTLIAMSAFFLAAQIGKALDRNLERTLREAELVNDLRLKQLERKYNNERVLGYIRKDLRDLRTIVEQIAREDSISRRRMLLEEYESSLSDILRRWGALSDS